MFRRHAVSKDLSSEDIESILNGETVARLAYIDQLGRPCIAPITYAYDGKAFYGYSLLGAKLESMSMNPSVCLEVERIHDNANWSSVMVRGAFEQLHGDKALDAVKLISERLQTAARVHDSVASAAQTYVEREGGPGLAYRILVHEKHGRYVAAES